MTRSRKRLLVVAAVIVIGVGFLFHRFYFVSMEAAIQRAEAFQFRRMTVAQLEEQGT